MASRASKSEGTSVWGFEGCESLGVEELGSRAALGKASIAF